MRNVILGIVAVCGLCVGAVNAETYRTRIVYRHTHVPTVQRVEQQPTTPRHRCRCGKHCQCVNCPCKTK